MCESILDRPAVTGLTSAELIDSMAAASRLESVAISRRFTAIGELFARRKRDDSAERDWWIQDTWDATACEIAAALGISVGRAAGQMRYAEALRDRLPRLAEVFATGAIDLRIVSVIVYRTALIEDDDLVAKVDAAVAERATKWMKFSRNKVAEVVDSWVARFDPAGVRVPSQTDAGRFIEIGRDAEGMASIWGAMRSPDAAILDRRLDQLAASVCANDPRTKQQRRADALRALSSSDQVMQCQCGSPDCPAPVRPTGDVVIHVLTDSDPSTAVGHLPGFGVVPPRLMAELVKTAKLRPLVIPKDAAAEAHYRPSKALAEFVRMRDVTCRFPGCDCPAEFADIDHTVPYPGGPTHPSNVKALCRKHHLLKTFRSGLNGWSDQQLADGTVIWTAPTGHTYTTEPGGSIFFPALATPTGELAIPIHVPPDNAGRGVMMPTRKRTRAQDRASRVSAERRVNERRLAAEQRVYEERIATDYEPPPF